MSNLNRQRDLTLRFIGEIERTCAEYKDLIRRAKVLQSESSGEPQWSLDLRSAHSTLARSIQAAFRLAKFR